MEKNSPVAHESPAEFEDQLTALLREGARQLLLQAVEAELEAFLENYRGLLDFQGRGCLFQPKSPLIPVKVPTSFHTQALAWSPHLVVDTLLLCFLMDSPSISTR